MMIQSDEDLPFDIKDERVIQYDLKLSSIRERKYVTALLAAIRQLERIEEHKVSFAPAKAPLGVNRAPLSLMARQRDHSTEEYYAFLGGSERFLMVCGISLGDWHKRPLYRDALIRQVERGCRVQVLMMDAENPALGQMLNDFDPLDQVQGAIKHSLGHWRALSAKHELVDVRTVKRGIIHQQTTLNENGLAYTPYYFSVTTTDSPTFLAKPTSPLYAAQKAELERLWLDNGPN
jgi:hypothetical protein